MSNEFLVRVYNEDPDPNAIPIEIDYSGNGYVFQPRCGVFKRGHKREVEIDQARGIRVSKTRVIWTKIQDGPNPKNYLDVPAPVARWALDNANAKKTNGNLKAFEEKRAEVERDLSDMEARARAAESRAKAIEAALAKKEREIEQLYLEKMAEIEAERRAPGPEGRRGRTADRV